MEVTKEDFKYETLREESLGKNGLYKVLEICYVQTNILGYGIDDEFTRLFKDGKLWFFPGQLWNGSNVVVDTDAGMIASLVHDRLIIMIQKGFLPRQIGLKIRVDKMYFKCLREGGMSWFRATIRFLGISLNLWHLKKYVEDRPLFNDLIQGDK